VSDADFDCLVGNKQLVGNISIAVAFGDLPQYLGFATGKDSSL